MPYKIYQPNASEKKYRFQFHPRGSKPKDYIHGLQRLKNQVEATRKAYADQGDEEGELWLKKNKRFTLHKGWNETEKKIKVKKLILCSGGSDGLNVACLGYDVCWPDPDRS